MNKGFIVAVLALSIAGCGSATEPPPGAEAAQSGQFKGRVGTKKYEMAVSCRNFDKSWFLFLSDETDYEDSNGDGIILSGMQDGERANFMIEDQGVLYGTVSMERFYKSANGARGAGTLRTADGGNEIGFDFSVDCG